MAKFMKLSDLKPDSKNVNVLVKVVKHPYPVGGFKDGQPVGLYEGVVGDASASVVISMNPDQQPEGGNNMLSWASGHINLRVENARVRMIKGHIRLSCDESTVIVNCFENDDKPFDFEMNEKNDMSATEYKAEAMADEEQKVVEEKKEVEEKKQEPIVLKKAKFGKLGDLNPDSKNVNVMVKCVKAPEAITEVDGLYEAVVGDASASVTISLKGDAQVSICTVGSSLRVQNARVRMVKGHIRLVADKWSAFKVADSTLDFEVNEKTDLSATEYEMVQS